MNTIATRPSLFSRLKLLLLLAVLPAVASAAETQAWLLLNPNGPETLMSTDVMEKNNLVRGGWRVSGTGVLQTDATADAAVLYRMFRPVPKGGVLRMLVASEDEKKANEKVGYITEGGLGYAALKAGPGRVAVYRFSKAANFIWLISDADQSWATKAGWARDKAVFWLWPNQYR
jgi:hypothetical protein